MIAASEAYARACEAYAELIKSEVARAEEVIARAAADGYVHVYHIVHKQVIEHVTDILVQEGFKTREARWPEELFITWDGEDEHKPPGLWARFRALLNNGLPMARLKA